jgi:hypothetical protein
MLVCLRAKPEHIYQLPAVLSRKYQPWLEKVKSVMQQQSPNGGQ